MRVLEKKGKHVCHQPSWKTLLILIYFGHIFTHALSLCVTGLKKIVWPLLFGLQIVKTVLLVLFLPSIIGSLGKIVGKGMFGGG